MNKPIYIGLILISIATFSVKVKTTNTKYFQSTKHAQIYNNISTKQIIYNRVPKCGSTLMMTIFERLSHTQQRFNVDNQETMSKLNGPESHRFQSKSEEQNWLKKIESKETATVIIRHQYFAKSENKSIKYINLVRNPIERSISGYYFMRYGKENCNVNETNVNHGRWKFVQSLRKRVDGRTIGINLDDCVQLFKDDLEKCIRLEYLQYFCGNSLKCRDDNDYALNQAKANILESYEVVGYLENVGSFLRALENMFPGWLTGATGIYEDYKKQENDGHVFSSTCKYFHPVKNETRAILKKRMWREFELYEFIKKVFNEKFE